VSYLRSCAPTRFVPAEDETPWRWETGTQNHEAMAGVTAAVEYLAKIGERSGTTGSRRQRLLAVMHATSAYERTLSEKLVAGLLAMPSVEFFGIREPARFAERTPIVSIQVADMPSFDIATRLGEQGFFVWEGNYYAINLSEELGVEASGGMVRIGCAHYNTDDEIDRLLLAIETL
jgi:selenocysteine lyase/cysteine desulfurase